MIKTAALFLKNTEGKKGKKKKKKDFPTDPT